MYNNGNYYGNSSMGMSYSPDRRYDVDRFNESTRSNYSPTYARGSRQGGYYHSSTPTCYNRSATKGRYLGNGQYVED